MFERKVVLSLRYDTKPLKFHLNHDYGKTEKKGVTLQQLSLSNEKKDKNKLDKATLTTSEYYQGEMDLFQPKKTDDQQVKELINRVKLKKNVFATKKDLKEVFNDFMKPRITELFED